MLEAIPDDLRVGSREGCLCRCANGTVVRVWADVSLFVGDYLQVYKTSKLMDQPQTPLALCAPAGYTGHQSVASDCQVSACQLS